MSKQITHQHLCQCVNTCTLESSLLVSKHCVNKQPTMFSNILCEWQHFGFFLSVNSEESDTQKTETTIMISTDIYLQQVKSKLPDLPLHHFFIWANKPDNISIVKKKTQEMIYLFVLSFCNLAALTLTKGSGGRHHVLDKYFVI